MDLGIKGKLAVVTGAGQGIGRAIAHRLAEEGAIVALVGRTAEKLEAVRRELAAKGARAEAFSTDLSDPRLVLELPDAIGGRLGKPEIVVHNAGGSLGVTDPLAPAAEWQRVWYLNLGAAIDLNRKFIPMMSKRGWGRIVHLSSVSAETQRGYPAYVSAKTALGGYVKSLARTVARDNIVMAAVSPGPIDIEGRYFSRLAKEDPKAMDEFYKNFLALGRLGKPEEIAAAVAYLCSEHAGFAVGSIFTVDGGTM